MNRRLTGIIALNVHHSASSPTTSLHEVAEWHNDRWGSRRPGVQYGSGGPEYTFGITHDGARHQIHPMPLKVWHSGQANSKTVGVLVMGDNTRSNWIWTPKQRTALKELWQDFQHWAEFTGIPPVKITGHRYWRATQCPGITQDELELLVA